MARSSAVSVLAISLVAACESPPGSGGEPDAEIRHGDGGFVPDAAVELDVVGDPCAVFTPVCPAPTMAARLSICGSVRDVQTSAIPSERELEGLEMAVCDPLSVITGVPCTPSATGAVDACGFYHLVDVPNSGSGFLMLVVDDEATAADDHLPAAVILPVPAPGVYETDAWSARHTTVSDWNASAARTPGERFEEVGVVLMIFRATDGTPAAGVTVTRQGMTLPDDDYYFSDTGAQTRISIDPDRTETGVNGSALVLFGDLGQASGTGGEPPGCHWPDAVSGALPDALLVEESIAECP